MDFQIFIKCIIIAILSYYIGRQHGWKKWSSSEPKNLYHGGCYGCNRQWTHGIKYCRECCYFDCDWGKKSLHSEITRIQQDKI